MTLLSENTQVEQKVKKLIELNDELENYFRNTIIPQLFVDADLILRKFSPPAMKQFKLLQSHIGMPLEDVKDNIRFSSIIEDIHSVINTGEILEKEIQTTDMLWFQMNIIPYIIKKEKRSNGVIITFVDITDRIKDLTDLESLNAAHETFIYSVSHDLKGPLNNIEGLINLFLEGYSGLEMKDEIGVAPILLKSIQSMKDIIAELSEITKIEANYKEVIEKVSFEKVLKEVELTIKDKIRSSKAQITFEFIEKDIEFSRKNIRSILYNLITNAIKYKSSDRLPIIHVKTEKEKGFIVLSVKDNGLGIKEDQKEEIFSQFTRIVKTVEGTGIGLYLVKKIVNNVGGKIEVDSVINEGSEFKIYLKAD